MDVSDITPGIDEIDRQLDKVEDLLKPLLGNLGDISSKLPLLDKAKLYIFLSYSINGFLASALRINGVDIEDHAVSKELIRLSQYFNKIHKAETPPEARQSAVDVQAAIRFLRSDLNDQAEVKQGLSEQLAKERAKADGSSEKRPAADVALTSAPDTASAASERHSQKPRPNRHASRRSYRS